MGFWEAATEQAGRQFGARYWRWFAFARGARRVAPGVSLLILVVTVAAGAYLGYRWLQPDWSGIGSSLAGFAGEAVWWVIGVAVAGLLLAVGAVLWRAHGWRLRYRWSRF